MSKLKEYLIRYNGVVHTIQLSEADAKGYGKRVRLKQQRPANKAATPATKEAPAETEED